MQERTCERCDVSIDGRPAKTRFCSERCRQNVWKICIDCDARFQQKASDGVGRCPACQRVVSERRRSETWAARRVVKPKPEPAVHTLTCVQCDHAFHHTRRGKKYCSPECSREAALTQQGCRNRPCKRCGVSLGLVSLNLYCDECRTERRVESVREARQRLRSQGIRRNDRGRAKQFGVEYEHVARKRVYERDGWKCRLCGKRVDRTLTFPHPLSASLDHVIPISMGGPHTYANTQLAHLSCNVAKSNKGEAQQLAMFG